MPELKGAAWVRNEASLQSSFISKTGDVIARVEPRGDGGVHQMVWVASLPLLADTEVQCDAEEDAVRIAERWAANAVLALVLQNIS